MYAHEGLVVRLETILTTFKNKNHQINVSKNNSKGCVPFMSYSYNEFLTEQQQDNGYHSNKFNSKYSCKSTM